MKLEEIHFRLILGPFCSKNFKIYFFSQTKKNHYSILILYTTVTSCKKAEKSHALVFGKTKKPHFAF